MVADGFVRIIAAIGPSIIAAAVVVWRVLRRRGDPKTQAMLPAPKPLAPLMLAIDDDPAWLRLCDHIAIQIGYRTIMTTSVTEFQDRACDSDPSVILLDLRMGRDIEAEILPKLAECCPRARVLIVSGATIDEIDAAVEAGEKLELYMHLPIRKGARAWEIRERFQDLFAKP